MSRKRRPNSPDSPPSAPGWMREFRGICNRDGVGCALCGRVHPWPTRQRSTYRARVMARAEGWTYREPYGWLCGCRIKIPGLMQEEIALARAAKRRPNCATRVQVSLSID